MNNKLQQTFRIALTLGLLSFFSFSFAPVFAQNPTAKNVFGDRLLKNYIFVNSSGETSSYDFYYNEKCQLMEIRGVEGDGDTDNVVFDYTSGYIDGFEYDMICEETYVRPNKKSRINKLYLKIGSNNFIESVYELYKSSSSDVAEPYKTWQVIYNDEDQLEKIVVTDLDDGHEIATIFTYDDGNIVYTDDYWYDTTVSYSSSINDDNIMLWFFCFGCDWEEYNTWMYYAGLLGKPTKLLPNSNDNGDGVSFTWSKSTDNLQSTMMEREGNHTETHTFTWSSASTGISSVEKSEEQTASKVYGLDGRLRTSPQKGFNIIETGNGKFEKVMK